MVEKQWSGGREEDMRKCMEFSTTAKTRECPGFSNPDLKPRCIFKSAYLNDALLKQNLGWFCGLQTWQSLFIAKSQAGASLEKGLFSFISFYLLLSNHNQIEFHLKSLRLDQVPINDYISSLPWKELQICKSLAPPSWVALMFSSLHWHESSWQTLQVEGATVSY